MFAAPPVLETTVFARIPDRYLASLGRGEAEVLQEIFRDEE